MPKSRCQKISPETHQTLLTLSSKATLFKHIILLRCASILRNNYFFWIQTVHPKVNTPTCLSFSFLVATALFKLKFVLLFYELHFDTAFILTLLFKHNM